MPTLEAGLLAVLPSFSDDLGWSFVNDAIVLGGLELTNLLSLASDYAGLLSKFDLEPLEMGELELGEELELGDHVVVGLVTGRVFLE